MPAPRTLAMMARLRVMLVKRVVAVRCLFFEVYLQFSVGYFLLLITQGLQALKLSTDPRVQMTNNCAQ